MTEKKISDRIAEFTESVPLPVRFDGFDLPNAGWEVRVAMDYGFYEFFKGLNQRPTQKPILLVLPRGGSEVLAVYLLGYLCLRYQVVVLVEDESAAMAIDQATQDATGIVSGALRDNARVVIGTMETLAKTDKDCYGGCAVLAYGVPTQKSYLFTRVHLVTKLCGWSAHLLLIEQPFWGASDEVMASLASCPSVGHPSIVAASEATDPRRFTSIKDVKSARDAEGSKEALCLFTLELVLSGLASHLSRLSRRPTVVGAAFVGSTMEAAASYYLQLFRVSGTGRFRSLGGQGIPAQLILSEDEAKRLYRKHLSDDERGCMFMKRGMFEEWIRKEPESDSVENSNNTEPEKS